MHMSTKTIIWLPPPSPTITTTKTIIWLPPPSPTITICTKPFTGL